MRIMLALLLVLIVIIVVVVNNLPQNAPELMDFTIDKTKRISVYSKTDGRAVEMDIEKYIIGVVAGEMPATYSFEALKAQAVCARSYTVFKILSGGCKEYGTQVCTYSSHCQAYLTAEEMAERWGKDYETYFAKIYEAVEETKGEILTYNDRPIEVMYHAVSGGKTENSGNVYKNDLPYLQSVESVGEESHPKFYGQVKVSRSDFVKTIKEYVSCNKCDEKNIQIGEVKRYDSGRVEYVYVAGQKLSGVEMRKLFSLNSTNFEIEVEKDSVIFNTIGYGHGVGLSQAGANAMALSGGVYREILLHYFTGVSLGKLDDFSFIRK